MKKYFIAFGLFCLSLFLIDSAYAATISNWSELSNTIKFPQIIYGRFCTSSTNCTGTAMSGYQGSGMNAYIFNSFTSPKNGYLIGFNTEPIMRKNSLYSASIYLCHNDSATWTLDSLRTANDQGSLNNNSYPATMYTTAVNSINGIVDSQGNEFTRCQYLQAVFQPTFTGQYLGFKVTPSKVNDYADYFFGYSLDFLGNTDGLSSSDVESVVKNSGLATATDIKSVKSAQQEIKEEITGMQEKQEETNQKLDDLKEQENQNHKETMDFMKDDSDVDLSEIDNLVGYLPAGPLDSIINLPLSLLNAISSNLSKTCVGPTVKVPFVNEDFTLPCVSSLYEKMGATTIFNYAGGVAAAVMLYQYFVYLYNWIDQVLSLKGNKLKGWGD